MHNPWRIVAWSRKATRAHRYRSIDRYRYRYRYRSVSMEPDGVAIGVDHRPSTTREARARERDGTARDRHARRDAKRARIVTHNVERAFARGACERRCARAWRWRCAHRTTPPRRGRWWRGDASVVGRWCAPPPSRCRAMAMGR